MSWLKKLLRADERVDVPAATSIMQLIDRERDAYQSVLTNFLADARLVHESVYPEIQIQFDGDDVPDTYRLLRVDALYKDGEKVGTLEANLKDPQLFSAVTENWNEIDVTLHPLVWNGVEFKVHGGTPNEDALSTWLATWYDSADKKSEDKLGLHGVVHSVTQPEILEDGWLVSVDFGSSNLDAFSAFIEVLRTSGAKKIVVGSFSYGPCAMQAR